MPKWIGNRVGTGVTFVTGQEASSAIYNLFDQYYGKRIGGWTQPTGLTATGGVISDYSEPGGNIYRAHIFTDSGTFEITAGGSYDADGIQYLVVAGGGGAGEGGGGAGGLRTNLTGHPLSGGAYPIPGSYPSPYTVTVGAGGRGGRQNSGNNPGLSDGNQGGNSEFYPTPATYPGASFIRSVGGGGGGGYPADVGSPGGSGGGGCSGPGQPATPGLSGNSPADPNHPEVQGNSGGAGGTGFGGGGGGAAEAGNTDANRAGGDGVQVLIAEPPATPAPQRIFGADGGYYAGGGEGGGPTGGGASLGGGGSGVTSGTGGHGTDSTGGGGGGAWTNEDLGGNGGSGIVVIRYQIGSLTASAKATGGAISFYNGKTIHTFTSSGTFTTTQAIPSAEFVIIGGGGAGGVEHGGGGGAGGMVVHPGLAFPSPNPYTITIGAGGGGQITTPGNDGSWPLGNDGSDSSISHPSGPFIGYRGGGGGGWPGRAGYDGGSGGGASGGPGTTTNGGSAINPATNPGATEYGNGGGNGTDSGGYAGGGGGGAGGAGSAGSAGPPGVGGKGGLGRQLPSTFQNPAAASTLGTSGPGGNFYFAGGGGGCGHGPTSSFGAAPDGGGGGRGGIDPQSIPIEGNGTVNTGGGGGGGGNNTVTPFKYANGAGGSGIVLIAYDS